MPSDIGGCHFHDEYQILSHEIKDLNEKYIKKFAEKEEKKTATSHRVCLVTGTSGRCEFVDGNA